MKASASRALCRQVGFEGTGLTSIATIRVPADFGPELQGMCGDCNAVPDDMRTADGTDVQDLPERCVPPFPLLGLDQCMALCAAHSH